MSGSGRVGAQPYQIENEWRVGSSLQIARSVRRELASRRVRPLAVGAVAMARRILQRLRGVLLRDRRRPAHVLELLGGRVVERREQAVGLLGGRRQQRRVQQQLDLAGPQPRRGDHRLDGHVEPWQHLVRPLDHRLEVVQREHARVMKHRQLLVGAQVKARDHAEHPRPEPRARPSTGRSCSCVGAAHAARRRR